MTFIHLDIDLTTIRIRIHHPQNISLVLSLHSHPPLPLPLATTDLTIEFCLCERTLSRELHSVNLLLVYALTNNAEEAEVEWCYEDLWDLLELTPKKDVLFIIGDWNAKVGCQEIPGVTGKFGLGLQNEAGQRLTEFCQKNALVIENTLFQQHKRRLYTWTSPDGQHQKHTDIFFAAKDGEALYSQQKQDRELTVAQIMNSLLPKSDLNWRK